MRYRMGTRMLRLLVGLVCCGLGISCMVRAELGLAPWDVLHQGLSERADIGIGVMTVLVGAAVLLLWIPLRERPGIGTVLNVLVIGSVEHVALGVLDPVDAMAPRIGLLVLGLYLFGGPGSGLYIGAGLGPGPRDGLMTGIARRGASVRLARTLVEVAVLAVGFALGGGIGVGTVLFAVCVGPLVHWHLDHLSVGPPPTVEDPPEPL